MQTRYKAHVEKQRLKGKRQTEIFAELLANGFTVAECASEMQISYVRGCQYMRRIRDQLGCQAV